MLEREKIITEVRDIVEKSEFKQYFLPIIEEFFIRSADQYNWTEKELNNAIKSFERVNEIRFMNFWNGWIKRTTAFVNYKWKTDKVFILFDVDDLKGILRFDQDAIDNFINNAVHELGHIVQSKRKYNDKNENDKWYVGLKVVEIDKEERGFLSNTEKGIIINEFAEVISAERLQKGNISGGKYHGYQKIQNAGKIVISSLGISEIELTNLLQKGREDYENFIATKLGNIPSKLYIDCFEEKLDAIYNFYGEKKQRHNLISHIDALQIFSKQLFEKRFDECIKDSNNSLRNLGRLAIDKESKDNALRKLFDEFNINKSELQIDEGLNIYEKLSQMGYDDDYLMKVHEIEYEERIKIQEEMDKQNEKVYDNEELRERIYQSLLRYPIKNVPLKDRPRSYIKQNTWNY